MTPSITIRKLILQCNIEYLERLTLSKLGLEHPRTPFIHAESRCFLGLRPLVHGAALTLGAAPATLRCSAARAGSGTSATPAPFSAAKLWSWSNPMPRTLTLFAAAGLALALAACGHNTEQRAATGAATGAVVGGPVGAVAGAAAGTAVSKATDK